MDGSDQQVFMQRLRQELEAREHERLGPHATPNTAALRQTAERRAAGDYRQPFALDADRILHSLAYARYIDKTQVFYLIRNDHITHRVLHVQLVSKIGRTVGRFLGLNEDLIEAIALGHDIGHAPFGHDGERFLTRLCRDHGIGGFHHNVQSVQFLDRVERKGKGWNLCLQTLDGILCHDGEVHNRALRPAPARTFAQLQEALERRRWERGGELVPMTMEGCVVRMADTVSYIGRDIEDAIRLKMIARREIPAACVARLGDTNGTIVYTLVTDLVQNSLGRDCIAFSGPVSEALARLKQFNLQRIYLNPRIKRHNRTIKRLFEYLFERYLTDLARGNTASVIFRGFLHDMDPAYFEGHEREEIVRDFIAGMTDQYFLEQCPEKMRPAVEN